ncbi:hypothetical protein D9M68_871630 [compost metagenome]
MAPSCTARAVVGSITVVLNGTPGLMPMRRSFSTMALSAGAGGLAGSSAAKRVKKACASIAATCSTGELCVSTAAARGAGRSGTRRPPPHADSGVSRYWSWSRCTAGRSFLPLTWVRPISQTIDVGERISCTPLGSVPRQSGPVMAKLPRRVPVVRLPGEANTLVHASISGIM